MTVDVDVLIPVGARIDDPETLHRNYRDALVAAGYRPLFTYVLDGDMPRVAATLGKLAEADRSVQIIQLSRRFGETSAILAGFSNTRAERVLILPAFEQVASGSIGRALDALADADLVTVRRYPRCDSSVKRAQSLLFENFLGLVGNARFRDPGCSIHALRRPVLEETQLYGEQHAFLPVLAENGGFKVVEIDLPQARGDASRSLQRPGVYLHRVLDILSVFFLTRFTRRPLRFFGPIGVACTALGCLALAIVVAQRLLLDMPLADRPALLLSSLLVALGLQIFAIGLIGELIVFINARSLKQYRIREIVEAQPAAPKRPPHLTQVSGSAE
jgi:hypothetical protein